MSERTLIFVDRKIQIKSMIMNKKVTPDEVSNFLGIYGKLYDMIFGTSIGMKPHEIPDIVLENMPNLIEFVKINNTAVKGKSPYHGQKKDKIHQQSINYLNKLFNKHEIKRFWKFISDITYSKKFGSRNKITTEANLIDIACTYNRSDLNLFERVWWFMTITLAKLLDVHRPIDVEPDQIATFLLEGESHYNSIIDSLIDKTWHYTNMPGKTTDFHKIFLKYEKDKVPAMFWNTTLFPVIFTPAKL